MTTAAATCIRIAAGIIGLLAVLLPWGSGLIKDETGVNRDIIGFNRVGLSASSTPLISHFSVAFIVAAAAFFLDRKAAIGQVVAFVALVALIPGLLVTRAVTVVRSDPLWSVHTCWDWGLGSAIFP